MEDEELKYVYVVRSSRPMNFVGGHNDPIKLASPPYGGGLDHNDHSASNWEGHRIVAHRARKGEQVQ